ncbi:MAG: hypothetical protein DI622_16285 [Chryseobacterium sp.]|nr:MAG: hypothetical protein DI622_16285 [Chryseobacterium sp.]
MFSFPRQYECYFEKVCYLYENTNMKTMKIYSILATICIILLSIWIVILHKNLKETEEVLQQCSERYYKEISEK